MIQLSQEGPCNIYIEDSQIIVSKLIFYFFPHAQIQRGEGTGDPDPPPWKNTKYRVSYQYRSGSPNKSQSYKASIQCWAIVGPPAKRHLNGVSLAGRRWPLILIFGSSLPLSTKKKRRQSWTPFDKLSGSRRMFSKDRLCFSKQCRPWWNIAQRGISSGYSLFAKALVQGFLVYKDLIVNILIVYWSRGQTEIYGLFCEFVAPPGRKTWLLFSVRDISWKLSKTWVF